MPCLSSWLVDDFVAHKVELLREWPHKRQSHRWSVITVEGEGDDAKLEVVMQTTKDSFRRGAWMSATPLSRDDADLRAPVVKERRDGVKVYLPLPDSGPRSITLRALLDEAYSKRVQSDDIPPALCRRLRDAIAATPNNASWCYAKLRWGIGTDVPGCPGCRACAEALHR